MHALPYYLCAKAVFTQKKWIVALLTFSWFCTVAAGLVSPFFVHGTRSDRTSLCVIDADMEYTVGITAVAVNNSMMFILVTVQMMRYTSAMDERPWGRVKAFFRGQNAENASGLVMQSGQLYLMCVALPSPILSMGMPY